MRYLLRDCVARPDEGSRRFGLIEHLIAVAERCGRADGSAEEKLAFLAGLLHDGAKAATRWQQYIRPGGPKKGPNHAPLGAALFAFWADHLIPRWAPDRFEQQRWFDLAADWTRLVYDHHHDIRDLVEKEPPWLQSNPGDDFLELLGTCDRDGLAGLVHLFFPESQASLNDFKAWLDGFGKCWRDRLKNGRSELLREAEHRKATDTAPLAEQGLRLAEFGARLIFADRSDAAEWDAAYLAADEAARACLQLGAYCGRRAEEAVRKGASPALVQKRSDLRTTALGSYRRQRDSRLYSLLLPTGLGKTVTGLRIALEACAAGRCRRVIYAAPYLSILSQAAAEIHDASGLEVFVHHHMTAALLEDHQPYDVLETWQVPVLATTFNQLCRALFPRRAQQCLRIPALDQAFVIIDEPQILDPRVWNLFLKAVEVVARRRGCQVLFLTATLPPTDYSLAAPPVELVPAELAFALPADRYAIQSVASVWDPERTAAQAAQRLEQRGNVAAILNTVRDAVDVFDRAKDRGGTWYCLTARMLHDGMLPIRHVRLGGTWYCLTARMLPGHKARIIREVRSRLDPERPSGPERLGVVATQLMEAGVDLSFRSVLRARPVYSSVVQAAGRANRHQEGAPAEVVVFPFVRTDGKDSRVWIYTDEIARVQTDEMLGRYPHVPEGQVRTVLEEYFCGWWDRDPKTACLDLFDVAARGQWTAIAGLQPFADDLPRSEVFIPGGERYLGQEMQGLLARFAPGGSLELLRRLQDRSFRRGLSFLDRKRLWGLVRQFTVSVPAKLAPELADETGLEWLWQLREADRYSDETGLALLPEDDTDAATVVI